MPVRLINREVTLRVSSKAPDLLGECGKTLGAVLEPGVIPLRFVISQLGSVEQVCDVTLLEGPPPVTDTVDTVFRFEHRGSDPCDHEFNAVLVIPTGIGAELGGHAGDACPVVRLMAEICDTVITHPNAVNASDINEIPDNAMYVEGSVLSRVLMGTVGLRAVRANRVMVIVDDNANGVFVSAAVNSVGAARAAYGLSCPRVVRLKPGARMATTYAASGLAAGSVEGLEQLCGVFAEFRGDYDAVALASVIDVPLSYHLDYFIGQGAMVNPWGGVEAMLTHALSSIFNVPTAHSPMFESDRTANLDPGVVDPRMAAEAVSFTFLNCALKGLMRAPRILVDPLERARPGAMTAHHVSCVVMPDGCVGLPTLAALQQGIPVIAVRENRSIMRNDLGLLPWGPGQLHVVENYWEAVGVMAAMKAGISPSSVRRPLEQTTVVSRSSGEGGETSEQASSDRGDLRPRLST